MRKTFYHGSEHIIRSPRFGVGNAYNDFGLGFYCAENRAQAAEWAVSRDRNGFVSAYTIELDGLRVINLCSSGYTLLNWISVLFNFREFGVASSASYPARDYIMKNYAVDIQGCDCMIGYRADNSCFALTQDFLSGKISYQALRKAVAGSSANRQFVLKSNRAFDRISFTGHEAALFRDHYPVKASRELKAMRVTPSETGKHDLYITQLVEEDIKPYDPRLR